jgi:DNA-binding NarL/FixJ family response regulator
MNEGVDEQRQAALRRAARALAAQDGSGIPRAVIVDLVGSGAAVTMDAEDGHVIAVVEPALGSAPRFAALSRREREVAELLARGFSNAEIADALVVSLGTVKDHVHSILAKTLLRSRGEVIAAWYGGPAQSA